MKPSEAVDLRDAMLLEAHALDGDDLLYVVCFRLAIELDHYAHLKLKQAVRAHLDKGKKKKKKTAWVQVGEDIGLTMSKKKKKK